MWGLIAPHITNTKKQTNYLKTKKIWQNFH